MNTDPIANMLTSIRNAQAVGKPYTIIPFSQIKKSIAEILVSEGYLEACEEISQERKALKLILRYTEDKKPAITAINRVSKPGWRVYRGHAAMPVVLNNYGIAVVSTSRGMMTNREARKKKLGGEVICEIY